MAFSSILKNLREERHLLQRDIARYLGVTRQAIASYELGKRQPDYEILIKLANYFNVSVDYLLGRLNCKDENAFTIGRNIELIRGDLSYKELSENISTKVGALIFPEMLELYEKGERMPLVGTIKIFSSYACVSDSFFYKNNSLKSFNREKESYLREMDQEFSNMMVENVPLAIKKDLINWGVKDENLQYLILAKEIKNVGLSIDVLKPLVESFKQKRIIGKIL